MPAGYSKTPLVRKLGIKPGNKILPLKAPPHYLKLLGELPAGVSVVNENSRVDDLPFIHLFAKNSKDLAEQFPIAKQKLSKNGMLWVSWIKNHPNWRQIYQNRMFGVWGWRLVL